MKLMAKRSDLEDRIRELTESVQARDAFIATIGHELRNPMTPIAGQVSLLLHLVRKGKPTQERLVAGLERLEWLIELYMKRATTLLDVSRITTGKLTLELTPVDVSEVLLEVAAALKPLADHARSPVNVVAPEGLVGNYDRLAVEQIVENLFSNAIKYGAGKPIEATAENAGDAVILRVLDRGIGISEADQARIFDRFERAVGRDERAGGFGVGLWIVCQLAEALGGKVTVESTVGKGSIFTVILPKAPRDGT